MMKIIGLFILLNLSIVATNIFQQIIDKINEVENYEGVCSVSIQRHLIRSEVKPSNKTVPSYTKTIFSTMENSTRSGVETLMCSHGLWLSMVQAKGTSIENHAVSKRACWPFLPLFFLFPPAGIIYASIFCRKKKSSSPPPAPNRPPTIKCPFVQTPIYAGKLERTVAVFWSNPTARDPEGGSVRISRSGQSSGSQFGNGNHVIIYTAHDTAKNRASCTIRFQVKVQLVATGISISSAKYDKKHYAFRLSKLCGFNVSIHPGSFGTLKEFSLVYNFVKSAGKNCVSSLISNHNSVQYCMGDLYIENGRRTCNTTDNVYGTECTLTCKPGFQFPANSTKNVACNRKARYTRTSTIGPSNSLSWNINTHYDVYWHPSSQHFCEKMLCTAPETPCNGQLVCSFNNTYEFESRCYPVCDDGYNTDQSQSITCNGTHWIGSITSCKDLQPPEFNNCPSTIKKFADRSKTTTTVTWTIPSATDNSLNDEKCGTNSSIEIQHVRGKQPGSEFEVGFHSISYTARDTANNIGYCNFSVIVEELSCDPLVLKDNYVLQRCPDGYTYGSECYFNCTLGYRLMGDQNVTCEKNKTATDGAFWDWSNDTEVYCDKLRCPDLPAPAGGALACSEALGNQICVMSCSDKYQVAKGTPVQYVCGDTQEWIPGLPPNCTDRVHPRNVLLPGELFYYYSGDCSNTSVQEGIKNNFVDVMRNMEKDGWDNICPSYCSVKGVTVKCGPLNGRRRRELADVGSGTMSKIEVNFLFNMEYLPNNSFTENDDFVNNLGNMIVKKANDGVFNVDYDGLYTPSLAFGWSELACNDTGLVPDYEKGTCVGCAPGKFLRGDDCIECQKGYYQDEEYQVKCNPCPAGLSTARTGSTSIDDCVEVCNPGTFSTLGVQPCSPCKVGQYQPHKGSTKCRQCTSNKYTESTGSTECTEMDVVFVESNSLIKMPRLMSTLDSFTLGFYVKPRNSSNSIRVSMSNLTLVIGTHIDLFYADIRQLRVEYLYAYKWTQISVTRDQREGTTKLYVNGVNVETRRSRDFHITARSQLKILSTDSGSRLTTFFLVAGVMQGGTIADLSRRCGPPEYEYTYVYNLGAIFLAENTGVQFLKSKCDAIDNCRDNPCGNNNHCTDELDDYTCTCFGGYGGRNCEIPPDFCVGHLCQNEATCVTHFSNYTCTCADGFTGVFCETEIVNGNWGSWLAWSECSTSCNGGVQYRLRLCTDPAPDQYGLDCPGSNISQQICNSQDCPVCPHFMSIYSYKNKFDCLSEDASISCNVTCQDGYVFVDSYFPLEHYECGPSSDYKWNGKPPLCCRLSNPRRLRTNTKFPYKNVARKDNNGIKSSVKENMNSLQCIQNNTCSYTISTSEVSNQKRKRRSTADLEVTITLVSNLTDGELNLEDFYANNIVSPGLMELVNKVIDISLSVAQLNESSDLLTVSVNGSTYTPDMSLISNTGDVACQPGFVVNDAFLCAECPSGSYWENDVCNLCPVGSYQDLNGQLFCHQCQPGFTTLYIASNSSDDCVIDNTYSTTVLSSTSDKTVTTTKGVEKEEDSKTDIIIIAVVTTVVTIILVICIIFIWQYREHLRHLARKRAFGSITSLDMVHPELSIYVTPDTPPVKRIFKPPTEEQFTTDFHHSYDGQFVSTKM